MLRVAACISWAVMARAAWSMKWGAGAIRWRDKAMRHLGWWVWMGLVAAVLAGCGGSSKPPMVPDAPDPALSVDGGADTPAAAPKK
jgi:hypothetical protein